MNPDDVYPNSDFNEAVRFARAAGEDAAIDEAGNDAPAQVSVKLTMEDGWVIGITATPPGFEEDDQ